MSAQILVAGDALVVGHQLQTEAGKRIQEIDCGDVLMTAKAEFISQPLSPSKLTFRKLVFEIGHAAELQESGVFYLGSLSIGSHRL